MQDGQQFYRELAAYYDELFPVDPEAMDYIRSRAAGGRPVLDAACGTGAHVVALEGHGIDAQLYLSGENEPRELTQRLLRVSPDKLRLLMEDNGFRDLEMTEGFTEPAYGSSASRVAVVTGRK
jgi:SAM-dependent methyltransferase